MRDKIVIYHKGTAFVIYKEIAFKYNLKDNDSVHTRSLLNIVNKDSVDYGIKRVSEILNINKKTNK